MSQAGLINANGGGGGNVQTLTGNTGGPVGPIGNNINVVGSGIISVAGNPGTHTLTISSAGSVPTTFTEDIGSAVPALNNLNIFGTNGISTSGAGSTVTISSTNGQIATKFAIDANTAPGTNPVLPDSTGKVTITGNQVATGVIGSNVIRTNSLSANTYTIEIQRSTAVAISDSTKNGVSHFNSANFIVDGNGFVSVNGSKIGQTITGDSGGPLSPTTGNWNILGRSGSKTSGSVSTLTVKSPPYSDQGGSTTVTLNSGSFVTAAITLTLPASAGLADGDLFEFVCTTAGALVIQAVGAQQIRIGSLISSAAGTATSTAIGDSVSLRFRAADGFFYATSVIGTWVMA